MLRENNSRGSKTTIDRAGPPDALTVAPPTWKICIDTNHDPTTGSLSHSTSHSTHMLPNTAAYYY